MLDTSLLSPGSGWSEAGSRGVSPLRRSLIFRTSRSGGSMAVLSFHRPESFLKSPRGITFALWVLMCQVVCGLPSVLLSVLSSPFLSAGALVSFSGALGLATSLHWQNSSSESWGSGSTSATGRQIWSLSSLRNRTCRLSGSSLISMLLPGYSEKAKRFGPVHRPAKSNDVYQSLRSAFFVDIYDKLATLLERYCWLFLHQ